jgi:hypothetical protein
VNADAKIEDLQAVSQHVLAAAEQIRALEEEKRTVDPATPRFRALSDEIERLAGDIRSVSHAETGLAHEVAGEAGLPTIAEADSEGR